MLDGQHGVNMAAKRIKSTVFNYEVLIGHISFSWEIDQDGAIDDFTSCDEIEEGIADRRAVPTAEQFMRAAKVFEEAAKDAGWKKPANNDELEKYIAEAKRGSS